MTKLFALLCLLMSSVLTVGHCWDSEGDVIVKDGHRVVVVEYDGDGKTNTRVLISPPGKGREGEEESKEEKRGDEKQVFRNAQEAKRGVNEMATKKAQNVWEKSRITVRRLGTAVAEALKLTKIGSVVSLIGIAAAYGMCVWVTVVSRYVMVSVLGRKQFGVVQTKVYAVYFKAISVAILIGLLGHVIGRRRKVITDAVEMWQVVNLFSSILLVEANASFVEPRAIKTMFERIKVEKEEGRGVDTSESHSSEAAAQTCGKKVREKTMDEDGVNHKLTKLNERLSRLNAYSSRLNLLTLMSLTWHFVYLGHRLSLTY
ncbi:hypothetical protein EUTSA_v10008247mg [Eutrema salsugineum]|uniref:TMEM205-like domain-containing protein n=1 Tax=Eutrema salsugineum TaxID=72664 RepID=V4KA59_EUTSA|nr:transmembrane protein 205 [Eutrema salsugineum]ESQ34535.1 hypothetical protein EUTSA_v10008247mg [Eutrema salsugineum]